MVGFFYAMNYKTQTKTNGDYTVINVYQNGEFWQMYDFPTKDLELFLQQISFKVWGTDDNLKEIKSSVCHGKG